MGKRIVIVESSNDQYFIEALVKSKDIDTNIESSHFCKIDDFECMEGDSLPKLINSLSAIRNRARKEEIVSIGIVLDQDNKTNEQRIEQVNLAIKEAFGIEEILLNEIGRFKDIAVDENTQIKIGLYLQNIGGRGNLETILKTIKKGSSIHADCLNAWKECIESKNLSIKDGDFNKFWVQIYQRYDQCNIRERRQAGRKCNSIYEKRYLGFQPRIFRQFKQISYRNVENRVDNIYLIAAGRGLAQ